MASSEPAQVSALEKTRKIYLECSICKEEYTEPKLLDCLHSFCKHCLLEDHTTNCKDAKMLTCHLCQKKTQLPETGVKDLKNDLFLTGLALQLEEVSCHENSKLVCKLCKEETEATHFCFDCPMIICANCNETHLTIPASSSHTVATLKDPSDGKIARKDKRQKQHSECQTHEGEVMWFYCKTCDVMICQACTVIDHCYPQHEYIDCNQASSTKKQSLAQHITPLEEILKSLEQSQATVSTMKDSLDNAVERIMEEVTITAVKIRAEVTSQEGRIKDKIKTFYKYPSKKLEEYEQAVSLNSQQIQHSLQTAKDVGNNSSTPDFLALYPTISTDLKVLRDQNQPKIDFTLPHLKFSPGVCDISLGTLEEPRWELGLEYNEGLSLARDIDASVPGNEMAVVDYTNNSVVIYNTKGHQQKTILVSHNPQAVAAFQNQLVVVDVTKSVKMYDEMGKKIFEFCTVPKSEVGNTKVSLYSVAVMKETIIVGDVKRSVITKHFSDGSLIGTVSVQTKPHYLAIDSKDRVIISGEQQVDIVDDNGAALTTIKPLIDGQQVGSCRGVCCDSSAIYVAVCNGINTGHIHKYDTRFKYLGCIAQGLYLPQGISLTSDGQQLAVADINSVNIYSRP